MADGYRESSESWASLLRDGQRRGMRSPVLAVGALGGYEGGLSSSSGRPPNTSYDGSGVLRPIREEYLIVDGGALAGTGAHSYSVTK